MRKGCSAWRKLRGDLSNAYKCLKGRSQVDDAGLFSVMCSNRTRDSGLKLKQRKFHLHMRKNFAVSVSKHWKRLSREFVESSDMETFKSHLDMVLGNLLWVSLLEQGLD